MAKVQVRKHKRKGKTVRSYTKRISISKRKRKVFTGLAKQDYEVGGVMDFEKHGLENVKLHFGHAYGVQFPHNRDYEISYHTHPRKHSVIPSYSDIVSMKKDKEREQLIFNKNVALSIAEKNKFKKISSKKIKQIDSMIQNDLDKGISDKKIYRKYKPILLKELGLKMSWHNPNKRIKLESEVI